MIPLGTTTISFNKNYEQKIAIIRDRKYPKLALEDAKKAFVYDAIDGEVSDVDLAKELEKK